MSATAETRMNMDKLSYEIFSILESKFLFGRDEQKHQVDEQSRSSFSGSKIRILSVDAAGATDGILAATSLARLESSLQIISRSTDARIADFFDVAAGSGVGGVLVALLFTRGHGNRPILTASQALDFISRHRRSLHQTGKKTAFSAIFKRRSPIEPLDRLFRKIFGDSTLRDTLKPVLIPCYDLSTGAPFLFSRADAVTSAGFDFLMRDVCTATIDAAKVRSIDRKTAIDAVDGGVAAGNPAAAAITHVLNNKTEFPFVAGVEDLLVLSLGNGETLAPSRREKKRSPSSQTEILRIAGEGATDMVDQAASMAFGNNRTTNYVRIQARISDTEKFRSCEGADVAASVEELLKQKNVESTLFHGRRMSERSNEEKLDCLAAELVKEHEGRKKCPVPVVVLKQGSPRSSSCSLSSSSCSQSPMAASASPR